MNNMTHPRYLISTICGSSCPPSPDVVIDILFWIGEHCWALWALLLWYSEHCYCVIVSIVVVYWHSLLDRWAPTLKQCWCDRCSNQTSSQHRHQTIKGNWNLKIINLILPLFLRIRCLSSYHCNKNSMCTSTIWNFSFISFKKNTLPVYISFPFATHLFHFQAISTQRWTRWSMWWPTMISRQDIVILNIARATTDPGTL